MYCFFPDSRIVRIKFSADIRYQFRSLYVSYIVICLPSLLPNRISPLPKDRISVVDTLAPDKSSLCIR